MVSYEHSCQEGSTNWAQGVRKKYCFWSFTRWFPRYIFALARVAAGVTSVGKGVFLSTGTGQPLLALWTEMLISTALVLELRCSGSTGKSRADP